MSAEREFLERSIADLEAEHAAGDLSAADLDRLRDRYERKLEALGTRRNAAPPVPAPRRAGLVLASVAFVAVVAVAAGVLVARNAGRREPGQTLSGGGPAVGTGSAPAPLPENLARCVGLTGSDAIGCFGDYTDANPDDPRGWTQFGLFAIQSGISGGGSAELFDAGEAFIGRALELDPADVEARVYLAVLYERTGRIDEAAAELARLDGVEIPADLTPLVDMVERGVEPGGP